MYWFHYLVGGLEDTIRESFLTTSYRFRTDDVCTF